ncbi:abortive infection domain protein [Desulfococcus multivorans]|nr:abortive infection domain protein [Desulfococcus multivorans]
MGAAVAAVVGIEILMWWSIESDRINPMAALGWGRIAEIVAFTLVLRVWRGGLDEIGMRKGSILPGLLQGLVWSAVAGGMAGCALFVLPGLGIDPLEWLPVRLLRETDDRITLFVVGGLIGPVAEEIFFRGILYGYLRRWGVVMATGISTAAFVLLHSSPGVVQAVGGILFAAAYEAKGRLTAPITLHVLGNTALFFLSLMVCGARHP